MTHATITNATTRVTCADPIRPLWRCVLDAINTRRQRQADRLIVRSLRYPDSRIEDGFRVELERRLMGQ